jgi:hypothetical protein
MESYEGKMECGGGGSWSVEVEEKHEMDFIGRIPTLGP